jgi:hypothetical protein
MKPLSEPPRSLRDLLRPLDDLVALSVKACSVASTTSAVSSSYKSPMSSSLMAFGSYLASRSSLLPA